MAIAMAIENTSAMGLPPPGKMSARKSTRASCAPARQGRMKLGTGPIQIV
jgi:hypothetical protein